MQTKFNTRSLIHFFIFFFKVTFQIKLGIFHYIEWERNIIRITPFCFTFQISIKTNIYNISYSTLFTIIQSLDLLSKPAILIFLYNSPTFYNLLSILRNLNNFIRNRFVIKLLGNEQSKNIRITTLIGLDLRIQIRQIIIYTRWRN